MISDFIKKFILKTFFSVFVLLVSFGLVFNIFTFPIQALTSKEIQAQKKAQEDKLLNLQKSLIDTQNQKNTLSEQKAFLQGQIDQTTTLIAENTKLVENLKTQKLQTEEQIEVLKNKQRDLIKTQQEKSLDNSDGLGIFIKAGIDSQNIGEFFSKMYLLSNLEKEIADTSKELSEKNKQLEQNIVDTNIAIDNLEKTKITQNVKNEELNQLIIQYTGQEDQYTKDVANQKEGLKKIEAELASQLALEEEARIINQEAARRAAESNRVIANPNTGSNNTNRIPNGTVIGCRFEDTDSYDIPSGSFVRPANGYVSQGFHCGHDGVDIASTLGSPIFSIASGVVLDVVNGLTCKTDWLDLSCAGGYGNHVLIQHNINGQTFYSLYAHLESANVSRGQTVSQGEVIGGMGCTGFSIGRYPLGNGKFCAIHLHFQLISGRYYNGKSCNYGGSSRCINPARYIPI